MIKTIDLLNRQLEAISSLRELPSSEHPKFKEWEQLTNSIIEKKFGKEKRNLDYCSFWPNRVGPWEDYELKQSLNKGLGEAEALLKALIQEIELLGEDVGEKPLPSLKNYPKLTFGEAGRDGKAGGGGSVFIQAERFNMGGTGRISADGGDNIRQKDVTDSSIQTGNINISNSDIANSFNKIRRQIPKNVDSSSRAKVTKLLNGLEDELKKDDKKPGKITNIFGQIKRASKWLAGQLIQGAVGGLIKAYLPPVMVAELS